MAEPKESEGGKERREVLKRAARFIAVSAPTVTLLLAAKTKPAAAVGSVQQSSRQFKSGEGTVDTAAVLAAVSSGAVSAAGIGSIDGVGTCFAAIKGLADRVNRLEIQTAAL